MKIVLILIFMFCFNTIYADIKSNIIIPVRTDYTFETKVLKKNIKKLKKTYVEVVPSLYLYKKVYLKVKLVTSYTFLDPNRNITYIDYFSPFDIGIMLVKLKITL